MARPREHGHAALETPEYKAWAAIKRRCFNKRSSNFKNYGGRGVTMCDRWRGSFVAFLHDVGHRPSPTHSIDRIDNDGHYEPGNVKWSTAREQCSNRRNCRLLTIRGETKTVAEWARVVSANRTMILARLRSGWMPEAAVFTPSSRPYRWATQRLSSGT